MKKCMSMLLMLSMLLTSVALAQNVSFTAGTYEAVGRGHGGDVAVKVTFTDHAIESVEITSHNETPSICDLAIERIPQEIIAQQSLAVDTVTGATKSSNAILAAVAACVELAGGDVDALSVKRDATVAVNEEIEVDVAVIGAGFAGLTAAVEAADAGLKVVVIEKLSDVGGSSKMSSGKFPAPQSGEHDEGVIYTVEGFVDAWMTRVDGMADRELVVMLNENSEATFNWLTEHGVAFKPAVTSSRDISSQIILPMEKQLAAAM